eukprot:3001897-Pleurochrysis_carterae.AAC.1
MKSANHSSAVAVRPEADTSMTRALAATRSRVTFAEATPDGCPAVHRSAMPAPSAPPSPIASTRAAM